jgi:hypothetical protein
LVKADFENGALITTACSGCSSSDEMEMFLPQDSCLEIPLPSFKPSRFYSCRHAASVVAGLMEFFKLIVSNLEDLHEQLVTHLVLDSTISPGWQKSNRALLTSRGTHISCLINDQYHVFCFTVAQKENGDISLLCGICNRRMCSHSVGAQGYEYTETLPPAPLSFTAVRDRHIVYSKTKYPFDYGLAKSNLSTSLDLQSIITNRFLSRK